MASASAAAIGAKAVGAKAVGGTAVANPSVTSDPQKKTVCSNKGAQVVDEKNHNH